MEPTELTPEERARNLVREGLAREGLAWAPASRRIGRNQTFIQQYLRYGTPKWLKEGDRRKLARLIDVDQTLLQDPEARELEIRDSPHTSVKHSVTKMKNAKGVEEEPTMSEAITYIIQTYQRLSPAHRATVRLAMDGVDSQEDAGAKPISRPTPGQR